MSILALSAFALSAIPLAQESALRFEPGDRVVLLGNALAERMQHHGWLEARLQVLLPELGLSFRNLGFGADELTVRQRTQGFGTRDEWLARTEADVVFAFYGFNESFAGEEGLAKFRDDLAAFVDEVRGEDDDEGQRLVLFSSVAFEDLGDPRLPDAAAQNARIALYAGATEDVAREKGVPYVDLFAPTCALYAASDAPLTINGIHLTERGDEALAEEIVAALVPGAGPVDAARLARVREVVLDKNRLWFDRHRATDGYNVYGGRSSLAYTDGVTNFEVLQREMEVLDAMCARLDASILAVARGEPRPPDPVVGKDGVPPRIEVVTNKPGDGPGGAHVFRGGGEAIAVMTPAEGFRVRLFADEARFPELANPVQMAFDPRGRLWVAVWPTYPHGAPGRPHDDKLLVLEDTNHDGVADVCTTFADDLNNPTGFELWNGGVLVAQAPDLLFLADTDGDDVCDTRERLLHGLSSADTHHTANSFVLGPDGAIYFQEGTFHQSQIETVWGPVRNHDACVWRFEPRSWRVERHVAYDFANPHGHVFDRWGQDFVTDGTGNENYYALPFSGHLDPPDKHRAYFPFFPQRSRPSAATEILSGLHFPEENRGNYAIANVIGFRGIFQYALEDDGSGFKAREVTPLVFSADPSFRPVDLEVGPDGALWFLDWHNPLIGHMQHHLRDPSRDVTHGRVYRLEHAERPLLEPAPIAGRPAAELLELLRSPADRERYRVRIELSGRGTEEVVAAARSAARSWAADDEHALLELLWVQQQRDVLDPALLDRLLAAKDFRARAAATRVVRGMRHRIDNAVVLLRESAEDAHPRVRLEALVALSFFGERAAADAALRVLRHPMDRFLDYALAETLRALEPHWKGALVAGEPIARDNPAGLAWVLARLETDELAAVDPASLAPDAALLWRELLARPGQESGAYLRALEGLAGERGTTPGAELVAAIERADEGGGGHADHLLIDLFATVPALAEPGVELSDLRRLSADARGDTTRRLATAARIEVEGSVDAAWAEAVRSLGGLGDLLDATVLLDDESVKAALFPRVLGLLQGLPAGLAAQARGSSGTRGRFVRVELPGEERTLTLAEVEVLDDGANLAASGTATQSSVRWGGHPERAVDGNTSPLWGDGGQTHTVEGRPNPWWELDLGRERTIDTVVVWNRDEGEGRLSDRLDGFVLRILDGERRTVFRATVEAAPPTKVAFDTSDPALRVRRAAARSLGALAASGVREDEAVRALVDRLGERDLRSAVVAALRAIPGERWPEDAASTLATGLLDLMAESPGDEFRTPHGRELLALADELAARLDDAHQAATADALRLARRPLGPQVVVLRPVPESLLFDRREVTVVAGKPVELVFDNVDIMPHNWMLTAPGALRTVGLAAERMAAEPDAASRGYRPDLPEVLQGTRLLRPGERQTLRFDAPARPGDYPYVCTFPGHWIRMNGVMHVVASFEEAEEIAAAPAADPERSLGRAFVREWTVADLVPHLAAVDPQSAERGRAVMEAASCLRCHAIDGKGTDGGEAPTVGPDLTTVVGLYERRELIGHVVEPSRKIDEAYRNEVFFTLDGRIHAGRVVAEDDEVVLVQEDPYGREEPVEVRKAELEDRMVSDVSTMPSGLLSTFELEEILALIARLESLAPEQERRNP